MRTEEAGVLRAVVGTGGDSGGNASEAEEAGVVRALMMTVVIQKTMVVAIVLIMVDKDGISRAVMEIVVGVEGVMMVVEGDRV